MPLYPLPDPISNIFPLDTYTLPINIEGNTTEEIPLDFIPNIDKAYATKIYFITENGDTAIASITGETYLPKMETQADCTSDIAVGQEGEEFIMIDNPSTSSALTIHSLELKS